MPPALDRSVHCTNTRESQNDLLMLTRLSPTDRVLTGGFFVAAVLAGLVAFFAGQGLRQLAIAPRYHPTLPRAAEVHPDLRHRRLIWLGQRIPLSGVFSSADARGLARVTPPTTTERVETLDRGNWIRIPALSLNIPLVTARTLDGDDVLRALQIGVVRYPNGVEPGQRGMVVVAGHSTGEPWKGRYRFAFLNARKLRPGDTIAVDSGGIRYTYRVTGQRLINPRETPFLESVSDRPKLTLITCWPLWTAQLRLGVDAELAETAHLVTRVVTDDFGRTPGV